MILCLPTLFWCDRHFGLVQFLSFEIPVAAVHLPSSQDTPHHQNTCPVNTVYCVSSAYKTPVPEAINTKASLLKVLKRMTAWKGRLIQKPNRF